MDSNLRTLDDPSNTAGTLLTLPLSDFPNAVTATTATTATTSSGTTIQDVEDTDGLILISLPSSDDGSGGLTMDDLIRGESVYILGDTSESDIHNSPSTAATTTGKGNNGGVGVTGSIEPIPARLIVEGKTLADGTRIGTGKTMELTRVETSNTYIVVPPMLSTNDAGDSGEGSHKRQKLGSSTTDKDGKQQKDQKPLVTMPARSIGLVPGEESPATFFLGPLHLKAGHFGSKLRGVLSSFMYDPFDPPAVMDQEEGKKGGGDKLFGYSIDELAHVCRTSTSEMEYALYNRVFGAEDALAIPCVSSNSTSSAQVSAAASTTDTRRYGMLSEEGRQTVTMAIVAALLESDSDLICKSFEGNNGKEEKGMELASLMEEVRIHWHRLEGEGDRNTARVVHNPYNTQQPHLTNSQSQSESQSQFGTPSQLPTDNATQQQLAEEVIWHCLRPILHYNTSTNNKDEMPKEVQLVPDRVAELAAHHVFLRGTPRSTSSSTTASSSQKLGAGSAVWWDQDEFMEAWSLRLPSMSRYEPKLELLQGIAICKPKGDNADGDDDAQGTKEQPIVQWQYFPEAALPLVPSQRIKSMFAMRNMWTLEEVVPYLKKFVACIKQGVGGEKVNGLSHSRVADLVGQHAKVMSVVEKRDGKDVTIVKYVAMPN